MSDSIAIGITAWNRPAYLRECLDSLARQISGYDWPIYLHVDGEGGKEAEILDIALPPSLRDRITLRLEKQNLGVNLNTYGTMQWIWSEGHDWAVYLEDDLVLSPDAFRLVRWYIDNAGFLADRCGGQIGAFCLCRLGAAGDPRDVLFSRAFLGWGFVMSKAQYDVIEPAWLSGEKDTPSSMWDRHVGRRIRNLDANNYNCQPALSRITNIGELGAHFSPARHRKWMEGHRWNRSLLRFDFRLGGWTHDAERHREA